MAELSKLGRYELRKTLGQGAMGVVYEGYDPMLSRRVAIKTILQSLAQASEAGRDYAERFVREARAVARFNHPNIVQVYDFGVEGDNAYLVMEFIQGQELRNFFDREEPFGIKESVRIMCELLDALDFAHNAGVIHRDVKPANVMIDLQRRVKLADFGVARIQDISEGSQVGTMVGTPAYMSPEQITGGKVDRRTDLFSAGSILYQFLTGDRPFKGGAWTVANRIVRDEAPLPSAIVPGVSRAFDAVVSKALAKDPARRFQSASEFAAGLMDALAAGQLVPDEDRTVAIASGATLLEDRSGDSRRAIVLSEGEQPPRKGMGVKIIDAGEAIVLSGETEVEVRAELEKLLRRGSRKIGALGRVGHAWVASCTLPIKDQDAVPTTTLSLSDPAPAPPLNSAGRGDGESNVRESNVRELYLWESQYPQSIAATKGHVETAEEARLEEDRRREHTDDNGRQRAERADAGTPERGANMQMRLGLAFTSAVIVASALVLVGGVLHQREQAADRATISKFARRDEVAPGQGETAGKARAAEEARKAAAEKTKVLTLTQGEETQPAANKPGTVFRDCRDCPEMVMIPAGRFAMGSPNGEAGRESGEGPVHPVAILRAFGVGKFEVTFAQWDACVASGGCVHRPNDEGWGRGTRPVINVSWDDARQYTAWLTRKTGKNYRLPTEAEWEYAARAGTTTAYYWGNSDTNSCQYANVNGCSSHPGTFPVGERRPNAFGLHDMLGNVWEWTEDCWNGNYARAPSDGSARASGECGLRVLRGGAWDFNPLHARSALRGSNSIGHRNHFDGFRVAQTN